MQPTYLPWAGFFNLMVSADVFVILDDAQFQRSSWHCRNRIVLQGQSVFLTVPIRRTGLRMKLSEAIIDYGSDWRRSHEGQLRLAYSRAVSGTLILDLVSEAWRNKPERLAELNLRLIRSLASLLEIDTPLMLSSETGVEGKRSDRLLRLCRHVHATDYLSPAGSSQYLKEDGFENLEGVALHLQQFVPHPYVQYRADKFVPNMSVMDVIANQGPSFASSYVRQPAFPSYSKETS